MKRKEKMNAKIEDEISFTNVILMRE